MDTPPALCAREFAPPKCTAGTTGAIPALQSILALAADDFEPVMNARAARWQTQHASTSDVLDGSQPSTTSCTTVATVRVQVARKLELLYVDYLPYGYGMIPYPVEYRSVAKLSNIASVA